MSYTTIFVWLLLFIVIDSQLFAQTGESSSPTIGLDIGTGLVFMKGAGISVNGKLHLKYGSELVILQGGFANEINLLSFGTSEKTTPVERITNVGILFGHIYNISIPEFFYAFYNPETRYTVSLSIGVGVLDNALRGDSLIHPTNDLSPNQDFVEEQSFVPGIPVQIEFARETDSGISYFRRIFYHWNAVQPTWGFQIGIQAYF